MTYANGRTCYDADSHLMETPEWLAGFADPGLRTRLPALALGGAGSKAAEVIAAARERRGDPAALATLAENVIGGPKGWLALGASDPSERSRALDELGFERQLVFSTFAATQFLWNADPEIRYGGARAHNRGMAAFCADDPRLIAVGMVPLNDPDLALAEVEEAIRLGCGAIWMPSLPAGERSPGHPLLDPVWALLAESGTALVIHIGGGGRPVPRAYFDNGRPKTTDWLGGGENLRAKDYMAISHPPELFLSALVFDGVFARHPELRAGAIELGAGWVPEFMHRLDAAQRMFRRTDPAIEALELRASEYVQRQVKFTPFPGEDVGALIRATGPELYLFSSDFPHPEGGRDPIARFESSLEGFDDDVRERFYAGNFAELLRL